MKKSEKFLVFIQKKIRIQSLINVVIYKKFLQIIIINLLFAILLLLQNFIFSKIIRNFDHNLDY